MITPQPLVSVIVPAYNGAATIQETIESVLRQDYPYLEILVISDGSRDTTVQVVQQIKADHVRVIDRQKNEGLAATLREGVQKTNGPIVMFLHQDCELMSPSWISRAVSHLRDSKVGWVTGYYETLRPESTHIVDQAFAVLKGELLLSYTNRYEGVLTVPFSEGKCDILRREALASVGGIPLILRTSGEDQLLSYTLRRKGWKIVKDGSLLAQQHYPTGKPLPLLVANLKKEFLYAKTQAVINLLYWPTILRDLTNLSFAARKGFHPLFKTAAFAITSISLLSTLLIRSPLALIPLLLLVAALSTYYLWKCLYSGIKLRSPLTLVVIALGLASFIPYGIGLAWGVVRFFLMKARLYTKPV